MNDVSTVVSICPYDIQEHKPGLIPSSFKIPKAAQGDFSILYVGYDPDKKTYHDVLHFIYIDFERGSIPVPNKTLKVAESIIHDYVTAQIEQDPDARPGMFAVQGLFSKEEVKKNFPLQLAAAHKRQENWFRRLVKAADDEWTHSRRHKNISNLQRDAANWLNMDKEWVQNVKMIRCPACQTSVSSEALICGSCGYVLQPEKYNPANFVGGAPTIKK